ncbi:MAG TPA: GAF domain-containing protein [Pyrinomonadaceae bacterium]|nr:GAF domain-containing protein [Pyrinomonadaceae bacterium]
MVPFTYRRISRELINELFADKLEHGVSLILLGPRYVGKRHVLHQLRDKLKDSEIAPIVQLKLLAQPPITSEGRVRELFEVAVQNAFLPGGNPPSESAEDFEDPLMGPLDRLIAFVQEQRTPFQRKPIFLIVSNVDGLAHHVALSFLEKVRRRIEDGKVIGILSAEDDVQKLVQGGFNCALPYVLQAYERDEFCDYLVHYAKKMNIEFESQVEASNELWRLTGGNLYTMRMILWGLVQSRARFDIAGERPVRVDEIPQSLNLIGIPGVYGSHVFRHGTEIIERNHECWQRLDDLIRDKAVKIGLEESAPTTLEVAGVAIREATADDVYLKFASPLHEAFVVQHYDKRRFGDLYAAAGKWDKAFSLYSDLLPEETIRPLGVSDCAEVEAAVGSLCSSLYSESTKYQYPTAGQRVASMKDLFAAGAKYLLGFSEISFWIYDSWRSEMGWQPILPDTFAPGDAERQLIRTSLPAKVAPGEQWQFDAPWNQIALVTFLPALREDQLVAVVVSELKRRTVISRERARVANRLLEHFAKAYAQANAVDGLQIRLQVRNQHVKTMNSIFNALGSDVQDVGQVLEMAAKGLRKLEYKRAFFSLVDPEEQRIQGFLDHNDSDPKVDLAPWIDLPLRDYQGDLQTLVIHERIPYRIADATKDGRVNPELITLAKLQSFALIPILNPSEKAIGTIHVERNDGAVPSEDEVRDLESFGRQLAIAIEQSERVNMLQSSLDKIPEPIVIVDRTERRRYANRPAAKLLGIPEGWLRPTTDQKRFGEEVSGISSELLHKSLGSGDSGNRLVSHFEGIGNERAYRGAALTDTITDWRGKITGGLLHVQDFNYLHRVFLAARLIGEAQDMLSAFGRMLKMAPELLGSNNWGRLYLADDEDKPQKLISKLSFGYDEQGEKRFNEGGTVLNRDTPGGIDWLAFDLRKPVVFCWNDTLQPGEVYVTPFGLQAINAPNPPQPPELQKHPGDFWMDFPLMTQNKILGKLCFQCDENLRPEDFELLKLLSEIIVGLFDAFLVRATLINDREDLIMASTAQKTVETIVHNLFTRFGNLSYLSADYWLLSEKYPNLEDLKELTARFIHIVDETQTAAKRAKEMLGPINPQWMTFDIEHHMRRTLGSALPADAWTLDAPNRIDVTADAHLLEMAILEMIQNSKDAAVPNRRLHVSVTIEPYELNGDECVRITYRDNGRGIPTEFSKTIYDELFSFRPGDPNAGTGLGLFFVSRVFKAHGGFIYTGIASQGAEFVSAIRNPNVRSETKEEERNVSHTYS